MKSVEMTAEEREQAFRDMAEQAHPIAMAKLDSPEILELFLESNPHLRGRPEFRQANSESNSV